MTGGIIGLSKVVSIFKQDRSMYKAVMVDYGGGKTLSYWDYSGEGYFGSKKEGVIHFLKRGFVLSSGGCDVVLYHDNKKNLGVKFIEVK